MDVSSSSSHSSQSEQDCGPQENFSILSQEEHSPVKSQRNTNETDDGRTEEEEQVTLITESMSVTSADEEKLLLLNRNTELRRINKELMKLNEDWDQMYRGTTTALQQRVSALEQECGATKHLNTKLLLKVEHEQSKRVYCEQTLLQELKKNQHLQEYVRLLESRLHHTETRRDWTGVALNGLEVAQPPEIGSLPECPQRQHRDQSHSVPVHPGSPPAMDRRSRTPVGSSTPWREPDGQADTQREMQNLKEQLDALRCQTKIYEADYKTEHKDRERMLQENRKLRRKECEMRQHMALLQEQLKVYEDDFRKERSDKQVLQRLLLKKSPPGDPVLVHRCNNDQKQASGERERTRERKGLRHCSRHCDGHRAECPRITHLQRRNEPQSPPFSEDYN